MPILALMKVNAFLHTSNRRERERERETHLCSFGSLIRAVISALRTEPSWADGFWFAHTQTHTHTHAYTHTLSFIHLRSSRSIGCDRVSGLFGSTLWDRNLFLLFSLSLQYLQIINTHTHTSKEAHTHTQRTVQSKFQNEKKNEHNTPNETDKNKTNERRNEQPN